jgi:hypothetical protein
MNTIIITRGIMKNGDVLEYDYKNKEHTQNGRFYEIADGEVERFEVLTDDGIFGVDLENGCLYHNEKVFRPNNKIGKLRLVYYRQMHQDIVEGEAGESIIDYFVVGWQTTIDNKNFKFGLKVFRETYTITEEL